MTADTEEGRGKTVTEHSSHRHTTPPAIHNTHHHTSPPTTHNTKGEARQHKVPDPIRDGAPQHTPHPPFNTATQQTTRGTPTHRREGHHHNAALHSPCHTTSSYHPPPNNAPPTTTNGGRTDEGYPTTQRPQRDTHPHCTTHPATNSARHDRSTDEYCGGMGRARVAPLDWADHQQRTPPPFNGVHEEDGYHPLIHSHCSRSHDQRTIMINVDQ